MAEISSNFLNFYVIIYIVRGVNNTRITERTYVFMGYYDNGTSAHRNSYYAYGSDYNRMKMQAEMTAEALASQLNTSAPEVRVDHVKPATDWARQTLWEAGISMPLYDTITNLNRNRARKQQPMYLQVLDDAIAGRVQVANIPESRAEALTVCQYIRANNKYPAPWGNTSLISNYRTLLQAHLDRADMNRIKKLTDVCINEWIAACKALRLQVDTQDAIAWETEFENLVEIQN